MVDSFIKEFKMRSNEMTEHLLTFIPTSNLSDVLNFFLIFARFEYALKQSGFLKKDERAKANWECFADSINAELICITDIYEFKIAAGYLKEFPPKIQIKYEENGETKLKWVCQKPTGNEARVLTEYIKRVRNNLFHGGKAPFDPKRDILLINHTITILRYLLKLKSASIVNKYYYEGE
jgi:hypothetical protein